MDNPLEAALAEICTWIDDQLEPFDGIGPVATLEHLISGQIRGTVDSFGDLNYPAQQTRAPRGIDVQIVAAETPIADLDRWLAQYVRVVARLEGMS